MNEQPTVSATLIHMRIQLASNFGADTQAIYRKSGIDEGVFHRADSKLTLQQENAVWRAIVEALGDQHIGLRIGQRFQLSALGVLGFVLMNCRTVGEGFSKFCNYEQLIANTYHHTFSIDRISAQYQMQVHGPWYAERKHTLDLSMAGARKIAEELTGRELLPIKVQFPFKQPNNTIEYERAFPEAEIQFSSANCCITFNREFAEFPVVGSNREVFELFNKQTAELLERLEHRESYTARVKRIVLIQLNGEAPSIETVAEKLAMTVRNLQLKLKGEETSFQTLLDESRRDIAVELLWSKSVSKTEIAYFLGFSEVGAFSRSFRKWTGQTPTEYQQAAHTT